LIGKKRPGKQLLEKEKRKRYCVWAGTRLEPFMSWQDIIAKDSPELKDAQERAMPRDRPYEQGYRRKKNYCAQNQMRSQLSVVPRSGQINATVQ
jgi:hypothetical protein